MHRCTVETVRKKNIEIEFCFSPAYRLQEDLILEIGAAARINGLVWLQSLPIPVGKEA